MPAASDQPLAPTVKTTMIVSILTLIAVIASLFAILKAVDDIGYEPPYFRRLRLLNEAGSDFADIEVRVKREPEGSFEPVTGDLNPPPPNPLENGWAWVPGDNPNPEHVFGVQISGRIGENTLTATVDELPGVADAEVHAVVDGGEVLWVSVAYTIANGMGIVKWARSPPP